jgi:hypothetical protein
MFALLKNNNIFSLNGLKKKREISIFFSIALEVLAAF